MTSFALFVARTAVTAWVGAAVLFVIVSIREVTHTGFDAAIKDQLVALRFPLYYGCGFWLIGGGVLGTLAVTDSGFLSPRRRWMAAALLLLAAGILAVDYLVIFDRLLAMIEPPGRPRPAEFVTLHKLSMWVNFAQLALCCGAMGVLNWPANSPAAADSEARVRL